MSDRRAILRRRALFLASGVALLSCGPSKPGPLGKVEAPAQMPPLEPLAGAPDRVARELLPWLQVIELAHSRIDSAEAELPRGCDITDPECEGRWIDFSEWRESALNIIEGIPEAPPCRGTSDDARAHDERWLEHLAYLAKRMADLDRAIADELSKSNAGERVWNEMLAELRRPLDASKLCAIDADNCARVCLSLHFEDCPDDW